MHDKSNGTLADKDKTNFRVEDDKFYIKVRGLNYIVSKDLAVAFLPLSTVPQAVFQYSEFSKARHALYPNPKFEKLMAPYIQPAAIMRLYEKLHSNGFSNAIDQLIPDKYEFPPHFPEENTHDVLKIRLAPDQMVSMAFFELHNGVVQLVFDYWDGFFKSCIHFMIGPEVFITTISVGVFLNKVI